MIVPAGGPHTYTEYEIQKTSSLGAPNWMRAARRSDPEEARRWLAIARSWRPEDLGVSSVPEFRVIERQVTEKAVDW
jgi:hypothetical protein